MKKLLTVLLTLLMVFTLVGCNSKEETPIVEEPIKQEEVKEEVMEEEPEIVGGYVDTKDGTITPELNGIFASAMQGLLGASYEAKKLVATQVVSGTNYKFLAEGTKTTNPITKGTYYIYINEDLQGNISLLDIEVIDEKQEEVKTVDPSQYSYWVVVYDQFGNEISRTTAKYGTIVKDPSGNNIVVKGNTYFNTTIDYPSSKDDEPTINSVKYLDWNGSQLVEKETSNYTEITNSTTTLSSGFYVVKGSDVQTGHLIVEGTETSPTYLILCNGAKLTATSNTEGKSGIHVENENTLIITAPKDGTGKLFAYGDESSAGIGNDNSCGSITINGGIIYAKGDDGEGGAGIGSGELGGTGDNMEITINGGNITAIGGSCSTYGGAGIGGGSSSANTNSEIVINGGTINATGGTNAAGIGGGKDGNGGTIKINGGTIEVFGGSNASGIGYGYKETSPTATITIKAGNITATGGASNGTCIGGDISFTIGNLTILAGNDVSTAEEVEKEQFILNHSYTYAYIEKEEACLAKGTLISMADGSKKPVEELKHGDDIKVFNHKAGTISHSKILDYWHYEQPQSGLITLHFTNNIDVNIVKEHSFYCKEENTYVVLNSSNISDYIGKKFYNAENNCWEALLGATYSNEKVDTYYLATEEHYNCVAEGMLTVEDGVYYVVCSTFDYDNNMKIDNQKKNADIMQYGLFSHDDFKYLTKDEFDSHKLAYLKVALGKGIITNADLKLLEDVWTSEKEILEKLNVDK